MSDTLDLARLGTFLGIADSSEHEGEALNAIRLAGRLLREAGMRWADLLDGHRRAEIASEAAACLLAENNELHAENQRLRGSLSIAPASGDDWVSVGDPREQAKWCLELYAAGALPLSAGDQNFLASILLWEGRLTKRQEPVFLRLIRAAERVGSRPP